MTASKEKEVIMRVVRTSYLTPSRREKQILRAETMFRTVWNSSDEGGVYQTNVLFWESYKGNVEVIINQ